MKEKGVKATFCTIGSNIVNLPKTLIREYEEGHQIVIHTWSHYALSTLTNEVIIAELEYTARIIEQLIGVRPRYFRPPFGDIDNRVRAIAAAMNLIPIIWNYGTFDFVMIIPRLPLS